MSGKINLLYVLITPARDEEKNIDKTIRSVLSQTRLPEKWVVVSDGSTDRTDEIVGNTLRVPMDRTGADAGTTGPEFCSQGAMFQCGIS
jgi:hypothetical protein